MRHRPLIIVAIALLGLSLLPVCNYAQDDGPARKLFNSQGCRACHSLEGDGGTLSSSFEDIRKNLSRAKIRQQLINPSHRHGSGAIPDFSHLSEREIEALVNFIKPEL